MGQNLERYQGSIGKQEYLGVTFVTFLLSATPVDIYQSLAIHWKGTAVPSANRRGKGQTWAVYEKLLIRSIFLFFKFRFFIVDSHK